MHKLHMHYGVALLSGRANHSAKLGWQKERARPAKSYCQPMIHFIFILQVDLVGNWLLYSNIKGNELFNYKLEYKPTPTDNNNQNNKQKNKRKRNITWFNPPYSKHVASNIG